MRSAEFERIKKELAEAQELAASATSYSIDLPDGEVLEVERRGDRYGGGWTVRARNQGLRAWTRQGWSKNFDPDDKIFCWPDAQTAINEIRIALALKSA